MVDCLLCGKPVSTGMYVRAKTMTSDDRGRTVRKTGRDEDVFVGYFPPEDRLRGFLPEQLAGLRDGTSCLGHPVEAIAAALTRELTPTDEDPVRLLWNPGSRVAPALPSYPPPALLAWEAFRQIFSRGALASHLRSTTARNKRQIVFGLHQLVDEPEGVTP